MKNVVKLCLWIIIGVAVLGCTGWLGFNYVRAKHTEVSHPEVTFEIKDYGNVKMELYPEYAPNTVANIIKLVENGYYTDKVVYGKDDICLYLGYNQDDEMSNPMISAINKDIEEGSDKDYEYAVPGEFVANDFKDNTLKYEKGVVSLFRQDYTTYFPNLREESYNSGNSQLVIMMNDDSSRLNGVYAAFGRVIEGMDVLEKFYNDLETGKAEVENEEAAETAEEAEAAEATEEESTAEDDGGIKTFKNYPVITSATVDTKGIDYGMPETVEAFNYTEYMNNYIQQMYGGN